jgi:hypothetical protein
MGPPDGVSVGRPLTGFRGVLSGIPTYTGSSQTLTSGEPRSGDQE